jgi:hypothetical protein
VRYIIAVIDSESGTASGDEYATIDEFNASLERDGHWIFAAGIGAPATAIVFDNRHGAQIETSGSVFVGDEYISGFWLVDADTPETARRLAAAASRACNRKVELRPFLH